VPHAVSPTPWPVNLLDGAVNAHQKKLEIDRSPTRSVRVAGLTPVPPEDVGDLGQHVRLAPEP